MRSSTSPKRGRNDACRPPRGSPDEDDPLMDEWVLRRLVRPTSALQFRQLARRWSLSSPCCAGSPSTALTEPPRREHARMLSGGAHIRACDAPRVERQLTTGHVTVWYFNAAKRGGRASACGRRRPMLYV